MCCCVSPDDIIGIVIDVKTKRWDWDFRDYKRGKIYPKRKIDDVNIYPGCTSLSYYRKMVEKLERASIEGPRVGNGKRKAITKRFLPLIIDDEHATRALPLLKAEIVRTDQLDAYESPVALDQPHVRIPAELKIRPFSKQNLPCFDHEIGFRVISAIMCADVVNICRNAAQQGMSSFSTDTAVGSLGLCEACCY